MMNCHKLSGSILQKFMTLHLHHSEVRFGSELKMSPGPCSFWKLYRRMGALAHSDCHQNLVPSSCRIKVSISLLTANWGPFPVSRGFWIPWLMHSFFPPSWKSATVGLAHSHILSLLLFFHHISLTDPWWKKILCLWRFMWLDWKS